MTEKNVVKERREKAEILKQLYKHKFKATLKLREDLRKDTSSLEIFLTLGFILFLCSIGALAYLAPKKPPVFIIVMDAVLILFMLWVSDIIQERRAKYIDFFNAHVLKPMIALIDNTWVFKPESHVGLHHYIKSNLLSSKYTSIQGGYLVKGHIGKTDFECSTMLNSYYQDKKIVRIFDGLFFHADFHKHFKHRTYVICKYEHTNKARNIIFSSSIGGDLVKMENPEFNRLFTVYSQDPQETRYIITPTMMEGMIAITKAHRHLEVHFSFYNSRVYCAIHHSATDLFEAPLYDPLSYRELYTMYSFLYLNKVIVEELDLNTRIWTKE